MSRVVLVGMMGAGKTSVGQALAETLGWPFTDTDDDIVALAGCTIPELFVREGEAGFRRLESQVLARALECPGPRVVAVGGGAVVDPANRALLADRAVVVWLRAGLATLAGRVGAGEGRPMLGDIAGAAGAGASAGSPSAAVEMPAQAHRALERLLDERAPLYEETARVVVDVDWASVEEVAEQTAAALRTGGWGQDA